MVFAGLTIFGTGDQASVSLGFAFCCAKVLFRITVEMMESKMILFIGLIPCLLSAFAELR
jgi:ABC-type enterochelin transport system permease subunit